MKKVLIIMGLVMVLGGLFVAGKFTATENRYYNEVTRAEEAVASFNEMEVIGGYEVASLETDWNNSTYGITVRMYTSDGVLIARTVYNSVYDFIEAEF